MSDTETAFKLRVSSSRVCHRRRIKNTVDSRIAFNSHVIMFADQKEKFVCYKMSYPKLIFVLVALQSSTLFCLNVTCNVYIYRTNCVSKG